MMLRTLSAMALTLLVALPAYSQGEQDQPPAPSAANSRPVVRVSNVSPTSGVAGSHDPMPPLSETIRVATGKSTSITTSVAVKDVVVGNSDVADVMLQSRSQIYVVGRAAGQTNVFLLDANGQTIRRFNVEVTIDAEAVRGAMLQLLPEEHGIQIEAVNDSLYLSGAVKSDSAANMAKTVARRYVSTDTNLVNLLKVANDQQVLLHVKVAEVQRTVLKELGVGLSGSGLSITKAFKITGSTNPTTGFIDASAGAIFGSATILGLANLTTSLSMLENQGLIRTLVEPNLTAVSGETATMLAGGELPIPVSQTNGAISVDFKPFGVLLGFTPTVLDAGRLSLKMNTEVSSIDTAHSTAISPTISVPAFKVRRAKSTVELPSGGSIMIAGLLQNDITSDIAGLPGAMDLPVLGRLFRSDAFQRNETELVVILSAYIVQAVDRQESFSTPTDGFAPTSDIKRFLLGRLQDTYTKRGKEPLAAPPALQGPYGYIVE